MYPPSAVRWENATVSWRPNVVQAPSHLSVPQQALWWLERGQLKMGEDWQRAHMLCQQDEGDPDHDLVHALCHWIEGDIGNRDYWYRRIKGWNRAATISAEFVLVKANVA